MPNGGAPCHHAAPNQRQIQDFPLLVSGDILYVADTAIGRGQKTQKQAGPHRTELQRRRLLT